MSEKKPICGILAGEPEIIGERCADGGKCHHRCTDTCSRRATCAPLSGSGLLSDWSTGDPIDLAETRARSFTDEKFVPVSTPSEAPSLMAFRDAAGDLFELPVAAWEAPAQDEREAIEVVAYLIRRQDDHNMRGVRLHVDRSCYDARTETLDLMTVAQHERIVAALARPAQTAPHPVSAALADVAAERRRQIEAEGWTPEHDDEHSNGEMALAAACYAYRHAIPELADVPAIWPWDEIWWKPGDPRRMLVKAAALILAEIERLDRAAARGGAGDE